MRVYVYFLWKRQRYYISIFFSFSGAIFYIIRAAFVLMLLFPHNIRETCVIASDVTRLVDLYWFYRLVRTCIEGAVIVVHIFYCRESLQHWLLR